MSSTTRQQRRIEYLPLDDVLPDERNAKQHDIGLIDTSIGRFGLVDVIVRDERTGKLISGHGRLSTLQAMRDRGDDPPEGVQVAKDGTWKAPVAVGWSSRSDREAQAALIALNRSTEAGGWEDDALLANLAELAAEPDGLEGVGFDTDDLDDLTNRLNREVDLDGLADEWDGETGLDEPTVATIKLADDGTARAWTRHREPYASDDAALAALLGVQQ